MKRITNGLTPSQQRTLEAARTLFSNGGYSYSASIASQFHVFTPAGKSYTVDLDVRSCSCKSAKWRGTCKHVSAMEFEKMRYVTKVSQALSMYAIAVRHLSEE